MDHRPRQEFAHYFPHILAAFYCAIRDFFFRDFNISVFPPSSWNSIFNRNYIQWTFSRRLFSNSVSFTLLLKRNCVLRSILNTFNTLFDNILIAASRWRIFSSRLYASLGSSFLLVTSLPPCSVTRYTSRGVTQESRLDSERENWKTSCARAGDRSKAVH